MIDDAAHDVANHDDDNGDADLADHDDDYDGDDDFDKKKVGEEVMRGARGRSKRGGGS